MSKAERERQCLAEVVKLMQANLACKPFDIEREIAPRYTDIWTGRAFSERMMREARQVMKRQAPR